MTNFKNNYINIKVNNCYEFDTYNICKTCRDSYYKTEDGKCERYPEEKIQFCKEYISNNDCKECEPGFYKKSAKECVPVVKIDNCKNYNGFVESECIACNNEYYLEDSICKDRVVSKSISNCEINAIDRDACEKCSVNRETNSEGSTCLGAVLNCKTYTKGVSEINCAQCEDTFFLTTNKCDLGAIDDCQIYSKETSCSQCQSGSYLSGDVCIRHTLGKTNCFSINPSY